MQTDVQEVRTDVKLPFRAKLGWGIGGFAEALLANGMSTLLNPIYNIALRLDPAKLGLIGSLPRFFDAIYDIWLGNLSDNTRSRWGRRRPFIFAGAVLCSIFFMAVWWVPVGWSASGQLGFFAIMSTGYWLSFSTFAIPYNALGFELTSEFNERTSVQAYRFFAIQASTFALAGLYPLCFLKIFSSHSPAGVPPEVTGARWVTLLFGAAVLLTGIAPVLFSRENLLDQRRPEIAITTAIRMTFTDRLFLHFIAMIVVSIFGASTAAALGLYVTIYHVFGGQKQPAANLMFKVSICVTICTLLLTLVLPAVARALGKRGMIVAGQLLIVAGGISAWWLYTPAHPYWQIGSSLLLTAGMACFQILYGSFLGDICDVDELRSGTRREGMYGAAATFLNKVIYASQGLLVGAVLSWSGYSAKLAVQSTAAIWRLRMVYSGAPALFAITGIALAVTFPITARRSAEVQRLLVEKRTRLLRSDPPTESESLSE
jgi:GPH family glycoside/pentoside/hexuronide:cation symporter